MKQKTFLRLSLLLFIASCTGIFIRCSSDDSGNGGQTGTNDYELTVFKNQTGNPDANALQAQYKDDNGVLNVYGRFDSSNNPTTIHTLTYQKKNNDTIVNMVIDPVFNRIKSTFFTINGTKQPTVTKFDYANENFVNVSFYDYDWAAGSAELLYSSNVVGSEGNYTSNPVYGATSANGTNSWDTLGVLGSSILISEGIILALGGETVVLAALGTAAAPIIATVGTVGVAAGIVAVALAVITSDANASELDPADMPYPQDTPAENPATEENDPSENLPVTECIENALTYEVFMDGEGTIVIESPTAGGSGPYSYFLEGQPGFTDIGIYAGDYDNGEYVVAVKDGNGCITAKIVTLNRDCGDTDLAVTALVDGDTATATATGGQAPYTYEWSNGSAGASVSGLADGQYTVTVTDDNGCTKTANVNIGQPTLFTDAQAVKAILAVNGEDVSDPRWDSQNESEVIAILTENDVVVTENRVTSLYLWSRGISVLPPEIGNLTNLNSLELSSNNLTTLPPEIGNLTNLTSLSLHWNDLTSLPPEIGNLTSLSGELSLYGNYLTSVPPEMGNLTGINKLYLHSNSLTSLPPEIANIESLSDLTLQSNQITSLPAEIGNMNINVLNLNFNYDLLCLPDEIWNSTGIDIIVFDTTGIGEEGDTDCSE